VGYVRGPVPLTMRWMVERPTLYSSAKPSTNHAAPQPKPSITAGQGNFVAFRAITIGTPARWIIVCAGCTPSRQKPPPQEEKPPPQEVPPP
jgi:hypothetical protein